MAKAAKKGKLATKAAIVAPSRPVTSPYTSPTVALHFGPTRQKYYVPDILLGKLENIPGRDRCTGEINLEDVDANIGHVLIHFLHTGVYQTLNDEAVENTEDSNQSIVANEFQTAVLVLQAAKKYGVPGLQDLAQIELKRRGEEMCLRDAVRIIREELLVGSCGEHAWLRDYISMKVRSTFEHDPSAILAPDFFDSIGSPTLTKLVAQIIVRLYSEEVNTLRKEKTATDRISAPGHDELQGPCSPDIVDLPSKRVAEGPNAWPTSAVQKFGAVDDSSAALGPHDLGQDRGGSREADAPAALPSSIEEDSHTTERRDAESWRLDKDKVETQHLRAEQAPVALSPQRDDAAESSTVTKDEEYGARVEPLRSSWDSLAERKKKSKVEAGCSTPPVSPPDVQLEVDPTSVVTDVAILTTDVSTAQKHPETKVDPYKGLSRLRAKKLKVKLDKQTKLMAHEDAERQKRRKADMIRQQQEEAEKTHLIEEARLVGDGSVRLQRQEEERLAKEVEEDGQRKDKEQEEADIWAAFSVAQAVKKKKESKQAELIDPEERDAELKWTAGGEVADGATGPEIRQMKEDDLWGDWGSAASFSKNKKKKPKKPALLIRPVEDQEDDQIRRQKEGDIAAAATAADLSVAGSMGATFSDDDCEMRVEHLSRHDGWQNCKPCEIYMRKIALKLHSEGLPIEPGFNPIN
ncbi:unnamed protein product [Alternaria burnsii]|nr:unnamed protein product [Alternaria burnsii]